LRRAFQPQCHRDVLQLGGALNILSTISRICRRSSVCMQAFPNLTHLNMDNNRLRCVGHSLPALPLLVDFSLANNLASAV
jgi:hypothetical protein